MKKQKDKKQKLFRLTTIDLSLDKLIEGQMKFLSPFYDVTGVASDTGLLQKVGQREGVRVVNVPMHREISVLNDLRSLVALYQLFRKERPYILHCNTPKGSLLGLMAAKIAGVKHRVYTVTGLRYQGATGLLRFVLKTMERISCFCATKVIPEGHGVLHSLQADGITHKSLEIIHYGNINGIDTKVFSQSNPDLRSYARLRNELRVSPDEFLFVFIGRIAKDKGIHELVYALRRLPQAKLLLVGSYDETDPVESGDKSFLEQSSQVIKVGWQDDVRPYLMAADALVFPSYREGYPNAPMQAGAMDRACIVTNINGCNEIIKDGLNGKIVQPRNGDALLNAMNWFVSHPEDVRRMAGNARSMIQERYEQKDVWNELLKMYHAL